MAFVTYGVAAAWLAIFCLFSVRASPLTRTSLPDAISSNGKFVARVTTKHEDSKLLLVVSTVQGGATNEIWRTELSNTISLRQFWVSDEGESVVTAGNGGEDGVAIYNRNGQLAKYSLAQMAASGPPSSPRNILLPVSMAILL